ncbi:unnamed protein product [Adineta steineri]|uniref:Tetraspanin n=1 Tax=Adineta steineri TaxID=433720 RepID=A0A818KLU3_9BILA|nr:unnamed protein product [Adineta steineri]CAF3564128.1 unnamed protein product [Adineta steineri]
MSTEIDGPSKCLLGVFGAFTLGSAIATLGYGIVLLYRYLPIEHNYGDFNLYMASIVLIAVGGLLLIALLLGVFGALKDISNLRLVTLVLLLIFFITLASVGIYGMVSHKTGRLQTSIDKEIKDYSKNKDLSSPIQKKINYLNKNYNCCTSYDDYKSGIFDGIPESCCLVPDCTDQPEYNNNKYFDRACTAVYYDYKSKEVFYIAIVTLVAAGVILLALILYGGLTQRARSGYAAVSRVN